MAPTRRRRQVLTASILHLAHSRVAGWLQTFALAFLEALPEAERTGYLREVRDALEPKLRDAAGTWVADYVRLRFAATRP